MRLGQGRKQQLDELAVPDLLLRIGHGHIRHHEAGQNQLAGAVGIAPGEGAVTPALLQQPLESRAHHHVALVESPLQRVGQVAPAAEREQGAELAPRLERGDEKRRQLVERIAGRGLGAQQAVGQRLCRMRVALIDQLERVLEPFRGDTERLAAGLDGDGRPGNAMIGPPRDEPRRRVDDLRTGEPAARKPAGPAGLDLISSLEAGREAILAKSSALMMESSWNAFKQRPCQRP